jgi:hypothetical protein
MPTPEILKFDTHKIIINGSLHVYRKLYQYSAGAQSFFYAIIDGKYMRIKRLSVHDFYADRELTFDELCKVNPYVSKKTSYDYPYTHK